MGISVLNCHENYLTCVIYYDIRILTITTQAFLMAEELNMHFSSVLTREDTSSVPVPETKFSGTEGRSFGQLLEGSKRRSFIKKTVQ